MLYNVVILSVFIPQQLKCRHINKVKCTALPLWDYIILGIGSQKFKMVLEAIFFSTYSIKKAYKANKHKFQVIVLNGFWEMGFRATHKIWQLPDLKMHILWLRIYKNKDCIGL